MNKTSTIINHVINCKVTKRLKHLTTKSNIRFNDNDIKALTELHLAKVYHQTFSGGLVLDASNEELMDSIAEAIVDDILEIKRNNVLIAYK